MKFLKLPDHVVAVMQKVAEKNKSIDTSFVSDNTFKVVADEILISKIENKTSGEK